jgi:hypothetical protein
MQKVTFPCWPVQLLAKADIPASIAEAICIAGTWRMPENGCVTDYDKQLVNIRYRDEIAGRLPRSRTFKVIWSIVVFFMVVIVLELGWQFIIR